MDHETERAALIVIRQHDDAVREYRIGRIALHDQNAALGEVLGAYGLSGGKRREQNSGSQRGQRDSPDIHTTILPYLPSIEKASSAFPGMAFPG